MVENRNLVIRNHEEYHEEYEVNDDNGTSSGQTGNLTLCQDEGPGKELNFGTISVSNSTDIHFGNKTIYQGPVTIKQIVYTDKNNGTKVNVSPQAFVDNCEGGSCNPCFDDSVIIDSDTKANPISNVYKIIASRANKVQKEKKVVQTNEKNDLEKEYRLKKFLKKHQTYITLILLLFVISLIFGLILQFYIEKNAITSNSVGQDSDEQANNIPTEPDSSLGPLIKLKIISRVDWLAQPPLKPCTPLKTPVPYAIISHTATENCTTQAGCVLQVRNIQTFHIESRKWYDIGYNFIVGGDGQIYMGRGWTIEGAHVYGYNSRSIGIAFIGTFINYKPPKRSIVACKRLIEEGVRLGFLSKDYKLMGARQFYATESPGTALFEDIKTWPHWSNMP